MAEPVLRRPVQCGGAASRPRSSRTAGAELGHVVRWTFYLVAGQPAGPVVDAYRRVWGRRANPPLVTLLYVAGLAHPDYLFEVETLAVVPAG